MSLMTSAMGVISVHSGRDYGASVSAITFLGNAWQDACYSASSVSTGGADASGDCHLMLILPL